VNTHKNRLLGKTSSLLALSLLSFSATFSPQTLGAAIYSANLALELLMPGAKTNLFGFGGPTELFDVGVKTDPTAIAIAWPGDSTRFTVDIVPPPPDGQDVRAGRSIDHVRVDGLAGPGDGYSYAESQGALFARLGNLSGRGEGWPPGQVFHAVFNLSFDYDLLARVGNSALEYAEAQVGIYARAKPEFGGAWTTYFSMIDLIVANDVVSDDRNVEFTIPLAPNSITLFETQFFVNGQARSVAAPPIPPIPPLVPPPALPEPISFVLLGTGIVAISLTRRRAPRTTKRP